MSTVAALESPSRPPAAQRLRTLAPARAETWALLGIIALAAVIRVLVIDNQSLWADEALTAHEVRLPFGDMLHIVGSVETTPPLFFVLSWGWAKVFGVGAVALRAISTIAGVAVVPIAYACAARLFSRRAGLVAAALVAVNPFLIWYSQEARAYMLLAALTAASFLCLLRALERPERRHLAAWAMVSALALCTHFFAGFLIAPEALVLLWRHRRRETYLAVAAVAVVQAAMLPFAVSDTSHGTGWIAAVPRLHRIGVMAREWGVSLLSRRGTLGEGLAAWAVLAVVVIGLVALSRDRRTRAGAALCAGLVGFVILVPLALGLLGQDYFLSRNEIPAFVPLVVLIAGAASAPRVRLGGAVLVAVLLATFAGATAYVQTHAYLQRPDWRAVAQALGPARVPRAVLVAGGTTADPLKIYLSGVNWVQLPARKKEIAEVDVVGALKKMAVAVTAPGQANDAANPFGAPAPMARPLPVSRAPAGTRRLVRMPVHNWVIARYALRHPLWVSPQGLLRLAHRFFRHTPQTLLVFIQEPRR